MSPHKKLLIIGASGHGKVIADMAHLSKQYKEIAFLDDNPEIGAFFFDEPVLGPIEKAFLYSNDSDVIVAIGNSKIREKIQCKYSDGGLTIATLVHPNAVIAKAVQIGSGSVVMAGAVINSGTTIGKGVIINTSSSVDHDTIIGDYSHVSVGAHLAGNVQIGERTWIGAGAVVSNNLSVCADVVVGAGGVVVKDISEPGIYIGIPAKVSLENRNE